MPAFKLKPGSSTPSVADFSVGGALTAPTAIGSAVGPGMRSALRELLNIVKQGAKKDPDAIFLAERSTGPRVPIGNAPKVPPGFEFGKRLEPKRSQIINKNAKIEQNYNTKVLGKGQDPRYRAPGEIVQRETAPAVRGLEDNLPTNLKTNPRPVPPSVAVSRQSGLGSTRAYEPSLRKSVVADRKTGMTGKELAKKYPNVNYNTLHSWMSGG